MFSVLLVIGFAFALWLGMGWVDEEMKKGKSDFDKWLGGESDSF